MAVSAVNSGCSDHGINELVVDFQPCAEGAGKELFILVHDQVEISLSDAIKSHHDAIYIHHHFHFLGERDIKGIDLQRCLEAGDIAALRREFQFLIFVHLGRKASDLIGSIHRLDHGFFREDIVVGKAPSSVFKDSDAIAIDDANISVLEAEIAHAHHLVGGLLDADIGIFSAEAQSRIHCKIEIVHNPSSIYRILKLFA